MNGRKLPFPSLPLDAWPSPARSAYDRLTRPWPRQAQALVRCAYGSWLSFARIAGTGDTPTAGTLTMFRDTLLAQLRPSTVYSYLKQIHAMQAALQAERDWSWMPGLYANLCRSEAPVRPWRRLNTQRRVSALEIHRWPEEWRIAFERAVAGREGPDDGLALLRAATGKTRPPLSQSSRNTLATAVGLYLAMPDQPREITPVALNGFIEATAPHVRPITLWGYAHALLRFAVRAWPERDWAWLRQTAHHLKEQSDGVLTKRVSQQIVGASSLERLGLQLLASAEARPLSKNAAVEHRDGTMILMLTHMPLRRSDFHALRIGADALITSAGAMAQVRQRKTGDYADDALPALVAAALQQYIWQYRPLLATDASGDRLWLARTGDPLAEETLTWAISRRTAQAFGRRIPPHAFRTNVATTIAAHDPGLGALITDKLMHRSSASRRSYEHVGRRLGAARLYQQAIASVSADDAPLAPLHPFPQAQGGRSKRS